MGTFAHFRTAAGGDSPSEMEIYRILLIKKYIYIYLNIMD